MLVLALASAAFFFWRNVTPPYHHPDEFLRSFRHCSSNNLLLFFLNAVLKSVLLLRLLDVILLPLFACDSAEVVHTQGCSELHSIWTVELSASRDQTWTVALAKLQRLFLDVVVEKENHPAKYFQSKKKDCFSGCENPFDNQCRPQPVCGINWKSFG